MKEMTTQEIEVGFKGITEVEFCADGNNPLPFINLITSDGEVKNCIASYDGMLAAFKNKAVKMDIHRATDRLNLNFEDQLKTTSFNITGVGYSEDNLRKFLDAHRHDDLFMLYVGTLIDNRFNPHSRGYQFVQNISRVREL